MCKLEFLPLESPTTAWKLRGTSTLGFLVNTLGSAGSIVGAGIWIAGIDFFRFGRNPLRGRTSSIGIDWDGMQE